MKEQKNTNPDFSVETPMSPVKIMLVAGFIFCLSVACWYYYEYHYLPSRPIPLLKADNGPTRIKPEGNDGALVPNTDKMVYENLTFDRKEVTKSSVSIMPEPEQPLHIFKKEEKESPDVIEDIIGKILMPEVEMPEASIQPITQDVEAPNSTLDTPAQGTSKILNIASVPKENPNLRQNSASKKTKFPYKIQLVSVRSIAAAEAEWERLKKMHHKTLGHLPHVVKKMTIETKGVFYRLLAGEFVSFGQAKAVCRKIGAQQGCLVTSE
ncbi:MAG: SPOR domain-containing protein [Pseudomonadota bacterium]